MRASYAVVWNERPGPSASGRLEIGARSLLLDGARGGAPVAREIPLAELESVRIGRSPAERLDGRPTLVLSARHGTTLHVAAVGQPGLVVELAERLNSLRVEPRRPGAGATPAAR